MYRFFVKYLIDTTISLIIFILIAPIFLILIIILSITNAVNPFFTQTRPGKNAQLFKVIKFKTMNDKKDSNGNLLPDAERLTSVGKFIRKTSLDELPQLINVLKGDMSLVGPRPLLVEYLPLYSKEQARRHEVRPGITGLAQINGRNTITWEKKFQYDVYYVDKCSFILDMTILLMTIKKVFKSEGINQLNQTTIEKFGGIK